MSWLLLLLPLFLLALHSQHHQIIDFTHTLLLGPAASAPHAPHISILPDPRTPDYSFPRACSLLALLQQEANPETDGVELVGGDGEAGLLRGRVLELLGWAEQIRKAKAELQEMHGHLQLQQAQSTLTTFGAELASLGQREQGLAAHRQAIDQLAARLNDMVQLYGEGPRSVQFKQAALHFQLQALTARIGQLQAVRAKTVGEKSTRRVNYSAFFEELEGEMGRQGRLILEIDQILGNFSEVSYLRRRMAGLQSKMEALDLYIEEKESCVGERARRRGGNEEIRETMERLRQRKKEFGSGGNQYCEGVAKKLESQIKRLLKVYNLTYGCAEGLEGLNSERARYQEELRGIGERVRVIEEQGLQKYQSSYNFTREAIRRRLEEMSQFSVDEYTQDLSQLDVLIQEAIQAKAATEQQLKDVPQGSSGPVLSQLQELVQQIKRQKAAYCAEYDRYDREARVLRTKITEAEQKRAFGSRMRAVYLKQAEQLQQLEAAFRSSSQQIMALLAH